MVIIEAISNMSVGELIGAIMLVVTGVAAFVENTSKTMKPLTKFAKWIGKWFGRAIFGELMEKVDGLEKTFGIKVTELEQTFNTKVDGLERTFNTKVDTLDKKIEKMDQDDQLQRAKDARTRVLRFGDEVFHNVRHTKEHFDDVLRDITYYEKYCDEHPKFENDQMHITAEHIKETYHKCLKEHSFL